MITAKNEKELLDILKIVCEEASYSAQKTLNELKDPEVEKYHNQFSDDEDLLGKLSEEEDSDQNNDTEDLQNTDAEEDEPEEQDANFGVSFDSVIAAINALRSGRSLRDSSVKQQALDYYDRLDEEERKVLLLFLNSFADILTGEVEGSAAKDPSDPPYSVKISSGDDDSPEQETQQSEPTKDDEDDEEEDEEKEEDTSPPIKVNEAQDVLNLRKKIRRLMI